MAKINLLTIQWGESYGATLQAYATCKVLENLGHEVTIINLINKNHISRFKNIRLFLSRRIFRVVGFELFKRKYFPKRTRWMTTIDLSKIPQADYYIVGSDQVWNQEITKELALSFFLDFAPKEIKRISLSSSFGKGRWDFSDSFTKQVKTELQKFNAISVREGSGVQICKEVFEVDATQLVDPTIALSDYSRFLPKKSKLHNEVTCFIFINNELSNFVSEKISGKLNQPIREIGSYSRRANVNRKPCYSPIQFLRNIAASSFVISDSFHGIVFAIIFKKQFVVLRAIKDRFERLSFLMKLLNLEHRIILSQEDYFKNEERLFEKIDYKEVSNVLRKSQSVYHKFIIDNIK